MKKSIDLGPFLHDGSQDSVQNVQNFIWGGVRCRCNDKTLPVRALLFVVLSALHPRQGESQCTGSVGGREHPSTVEGLSAHLNTSLLDGDPCSVLLKVSLVQLVRFPVGGIWGARVR